MPGFRALNPVRVLPITISGGPMRRPARSTLLRSFAALVAVVVLAACSSEPDEGGDASATTTSATAAPADADAYADAVCGALGDWMTSIEEGNASLQDSLGDEVDLENVKQGLLDFLDDTIANTDEMVATIEDAGVPDVDNGQQVHDEIVSLLGQAQTAFEDARDTVDGLDASDPQALGQGLQELGTSLQSAFDEVQNPLENTDSTELNEAFESNEACTALDDMAA
jgi:hypothetical protein